MKVLLEIESEELEAIIEWLKYTQKTLVPSFAEGYHQLTHLIEKITLPVKA
jgi:hypothetical protein